MTSSFYMSIAMSLACFTIIYAESVTASPDEYESDKKHVRIEARHIEGGGIGYNQGYTTLEAFLAPNPGMWAVMPFLDIRGHIFNNGKWATNAGLGLRGIFGCRTYGINSYYDYRDTKRKHYNQIGIGLETLGRRWDFRANGYLPVGNKLSNKFDQTTHVTDGTFDSFSENYVLITQTETTSWKKQYAMKGLDAEAAVHFLNSKNFDLYAAAGPYYYNYKNKQAIGGQARVGVQIYQYASLELINSYDSRFHENFQGQIGLSMPLGRKKSAKSKKLNNCSDSYLLTQRLVQGVKRQEIIVVDDFSQTQTTNLLSTAIDPQTGNPYFLVFVDNTSNSLGTFESPYPSLSLAQENSLENQIIYVFPGDGTTTNMDQGITLKAGQKLWGSAVAYNLQTTEGPVTLPQMSTSAPQITNVDLLGVGTTLSTNNEISGITFIQTSGQAILGIDPVEISLSSCSFVSCGQGDLGIYPVVFHVSSPFIATIDNNNFTTNPNAGIFTQLLPGASSTQIEMNNNQAYNNQGSSGGAAILTLEAHGPIGACELVMANNIFNNNECGSVNISDLNTPHEGSFESFHGTFTTNTFTENTQGILFATNADNCTMSIQSNDLSDCARGSIAILAGPAGTQLVSNAALLIDSNQINGGGNEGDAITISPAGNSLSVTLTNNSISNNEGSGFVSFFNQPGPNATLLIANNLIANNLNVANFNASGGISFDGFNSVIATIEKNTFIENAQGNSIGRYGSSFMTTPDTSSVVFADNQLTNDTFDFEFYGNSPSVGCLTILGNTSTIDPTYTFQMNGTGSGYIVPCDYETANIGGFNLLDVTSSKDCSGDPCL